MAQYDLILAGTGFASSFFLHAWLAAAPASARALVLERGPDNPHSWQVQNRRTSSISPDDTYVRRSDPAVKTWNFTVGFGGGSNCWWAVTPRMLPNDFRMQTRYGVGRDWPITYDDLEAYYDAAERLLMVSGPDETAFPRRGPYPQPPHRLSDMDRLLARTFPGLYHAQPTARAREKTANRPACCTTGTCTICPVNAKFTVLNELSHLYADPRVTLLTEATVETVETTGGVASGVTYNRKGAAASATADLVALGANALFNPLILLRSGLDHPLLGRRLHEQVSVGAVIDLDGPDNYNGSTSITANGYMLYDGDHRRQRAACLIESLNTPHASNLPALRNERGQWRQRLVLKFIFEDMPDEANGVALNPDDPARPVVSHGPRSDYAQRSIDALPGLIDDLFRDLPVTHIAIDPRPATSEGHILGTTVMGDDPATSVIDRHLIHHTVRNLVVLGSGAYPAGSPTNPTLTLCALSLWAGEYLFARGPEG